MFDRLTKVHYPDGTFEQTIYKYLSTQRTRDRLGRWTDYFVDPLQKVRAVRDSLGRTTQFQWCGCGALEAVVDPLNRVTMWNRDIEGRVTSKLYPDGKTDTYLYETNSSRLKTFTDALNNSINYSYFEDDNIKEMQRPNATEANPSVQFTYDSTYNRVSTISTVEYSTASYTYNYQAVPTNIPTSTTGNGMLSSINGTIGMSGNTYTVAYTYDQLGRATGRAIDGVSATVTYDALGRVTQANNVLGSFTNNYVGVAPRLSSVSYPNGQTTMFSYFGTNGNERLSEIWNQNAGGTNISKFDYTYDANGQIQTWTQQADAATPQVYNYEYDRAGQLMSAVLKTTGASPAVLKQFAYLYDSSGNRTSEQIGGSSPLQTSLNSASYNNLNQLTGQSPGGTLQVKGTLNAMAPVTVNQTAATVNADDSFTGSATNISASVAGTSNGVSVVTAYASGQATNRYGVTVTGNTNLTLVYDATGNLLADGTGRTYDWENGALAGITNGAHVSKFFYDGMGRRIQALEYQGGIQVSNSVYVWCGSELCEDRIGTGGGSSSLVNYQFFPQGERAASASQNYYYTRDHLGSIREMTDSTGAIRARYDYDPYGRQTQLSGDKAANFGYAGMYVHQPSGLNLTLFRAYNPNLGRWLSRDPAAESGSGLNLYAYVFNDPINGVDPLGLWSWSGFATGLAIGVGTVALGVGIGLLLAPVIAAGIAAGGIIAAATYGAVGVAALVGGFGTGEAAYEAGSGRAWAANGNGRKLCDNERSAAAGEALVGLATLGLGARLGAAKQPTQVTAQTIAKALKGSTMQTAQKDVSLPVIERYVRLLEAGNTPPPIKTDGNVIVDGNHRYVAGQLMGADTPTAPGTLSPSQAGNVQPIQNISVDPTDWGND